MIETFFSLISGVKGLIVIGLGFLASLWAFWAKRKMNKQQETINWQDRVISTHKVADQIRSKDKETEKGIEEIKDEVDKADNTADIESGFDRLRNYKRDTDRG